MSKTYRFYPTADARQDDIWDYTLKHWGQAQAEHYIKGLHVHLQKLADKNLVWHSLPQRLSTPPDLDIIVYASQYEKHMIFFRELDPDVIGIIGLYHIAMDLPVRLQDDLETIRKASEQGGVLPD